MLSIADNSYHYYPYPRWAFLKAERAAFWPAVSFWPGLSHARSLKIGIEVAHNKRRKNHTE